MEESWKRDMSALLEGGFVTACMDGGIWSLIFCGTGKAQGTIPPIAFAQLLHRLAVRDAACRIKTSTDNNSLRAPSKNR